MSIEEKVALITGTGQAIALRLATDGAHTAIVDIGGEETAAVADEVRAA